jgi:hypothetical protein
MSCPFGPTKLAIFGISTFNYFLIFQDWKCWAWKAATFRMKPAFPILRQMLRIHVKAKKDAESIRSMVWQIEDPNRNLLGVPGGEQMLRLSLSSGKTVYDGFDVVIAGSNMVDDRLDLSANVSKASAAEIRIFDTAGRLLDTRIFNLIEGRQVVALRNLSLTPGAYLLFVQSALGQRALRFTKF